MTGIVQIIGIKPPLALSLYRINHNKWAEQRKNYGYKNVSPNRLMISLAGLPIDVRTDFNSFLPVVYGNEKKNYKLLYNN